MAEFDASAAAARAVGNLAEGDLDAPTSATDADVAEAAAEVKGSTPSNQSEQLTPMDVLMHTEPDLKPDDVQERVGLSPAGAHGLIGARKCAHAVTGKGGENDGTPAVINFATAGYHFFVAPSSTGDDDGEETTDQEPSAAVEGRDVL